MISGAIISVQSCPQSKCLPPTAAHPVRNHVYCLLSWCDSGFDRSSGSSQVKSSHSRRSMEAILAATPRHSAHDTFRLQSKPLSGKTSYKSSSLAPRSLSQKLSSSGYLRLHCSLRVAKGISTRKHCNLFSLNNSDECLNGHYPIFNPVSCELLTVGAHTTWFCHLSGVWMKGKMNISIELRETQPLDSRWIEKNKSLRGVRRLTTESNKWQGEQGHYEDSKN